MNIRAWFVAMMALIPVMIPALTPALAEEFTPVQSQSDFVELIEGKALTRVGIRLVVSEAGGIEGRAFGLPVTGAWRWDAGYFCRDLYYGEEALEPNCQAVLVSGDTIRFISDQGAGQFADLRLK